MRISDHILPVALLSLGLGLTTAHAFDGRKSPDTSPEIPGVGPVVKPQTPLDGGAPTQLRSWWHLMQAGDSEWVKAADDAFHRDGDVVAGWKLGRIYADGDGVKQDQVRAFGYFRAVVESQHDDVRGASSRFVASAWVSMGQYYLNGIPNSEIKPDAVRALQYFTLAAVNLGDADAQYHLGRMYLDGQGVAKAPMQAARWFYQSAMKGQYEAQAEFGRLLFKGQVVPREGAKGLMWLRIAVDTAPNGVTGPQEVYNSAYKQATDQERSDAAVYYEQWKQRGHPGR